MSGRRAVPTRTGAIAISALLALAAGCASGPKPAAEPPALVWPAPPMTARITFVRSIASDEDVGKDTTFSQKFLDFLGGEQPTPNRVVEPLGLAVSDDGARLYVSDFAQQAVYVFDLEAKTFHKVGGEEKLARPVGVALDAEERLYIVEQQKRGVSVFDREGRRVAFFTHPSVERPTGVAVDRARGRVYLADTGHTRSEAHTVKVFDTNGGLVGTIGREKGGEPGQFMFPTYLAVDAAGNLYVTDTLNSRVQVFDPDGKYLRSFGQRGNAWGMFDKPKGVALDAFGNLYVVDSGWSNVQIFNQKGQVLLFFGGRGPIPGLLMNPTAIAIDRRNRIYVGDYLNHRVGVYQLVNTTAGDSFLDPTTQTGGAGPAKGATSDAAPTRAN